MLLQHGLEQSVDVTDVWHAFSPIAEFMWKVCCESRMWDVLVMGNTGQAIKDVKVSAVYSCAGRSIKNLTKALSLLYFWGICTSLAVFHSIKLSIHYITWTRSTQKDSEQLTEALYYIFCVIITRRKDIITACKQYPTKHYICLRQVIVEQQLKTQVCEVWRI